MTDKPVPHYIVLECLDSVEQFIVIIITSLKGGWVTLLYAIPQLMILNIFLTVTHTIRLVKTILIDTSES